MNVVFELIECSVRMHDSSKMDDESSPTSVHFNWTVRNV